MQNTVIVQVQIGVYFKYIIENTKYKITTLGRSYSCQKDANSR